MSPRFASSQMTSETRSSFMASHVEDDRRLPAPVVEAHVEVVHRRGLHRRTNHARLDAAHGRDDVLVGDLLDVHVGEDLLARLGQVDELVEPIGEERLEVDRAEHDARRAARSRPARCTSPAVSSQSARAASSKTARSVSASTRSRTSPRCSSNVCCAPAIDRRRWSRGSSKSVPIHHTLEASGARISSTTRRSGSFRRARGADARVADDRRDDHGRVRKAELLLHVGSG